jgi:uncharacterized membrane protein
VYKVLNTALKQPLFWLALWTVTGLFLRLINLSGKPPWIDEFATIVFSLGNSFKSVPLDRLIDLSELTSPLALNPNATVADVIQRIFTEDQHPPTYFALNHLWFKLFPAQQGLVDLWAARLLSTVFGVLAIPTIYICSYLIFRSNLVAHFTAAIMAVSPYGVYIAQEARHYSFAILWVIISITCFVSTCQLITYRRQLPLILIFGWSLVNNLGMATHYFFVLTIMAETFALIIFLTWHYYTKYATDPETDRKMNYEDLKDFLKWNKANLIRLSIVGTGTMIGTIIWLKIFRDSSIPVLTNWLKAQISNPYDAVINPLFRILGYLLTNFSLLFAESNSPLLVALSILIMLPFFIWLLIISCRAISNRWKGNSLKYQTEIITLISFCGGSIGLFLIFPYLIKVDITLAPRFQFVYFPGIIMLAGFVLAQCWDSKQLITVWIGNKQGVVVILLMGIVGSYVVASNQGYLKSYAPNDMVALIDKSSPKPVLIATTHNSLTQVGEMMSIAWEMKQVEKSDQVHSTQFLLAHQDHLTCSSNCIATNKLQKVVDSLSSPHDLWLINFSSPVNLPSTCNIDNTIKSRVRGYGYHLYHC